MYYYGLLLLYFVGYRYSSVQGIVTTYLQLQTYTNPGWKLAYPDLTCVSTFNGKSFPNCLFQFTTTITFAKYNKLPRVYSTHLIPVTTDNPLQFSNTTAIPGCDPTYTTSTNFNCNDQTWTTVQNFTSDEKPLAVQVMVQHYGSTVYKGTPVPASYVPSSNWYTDSFYLNLFRITPFAGNVTMQNTTTTLYGSENNNQSTLLLTVSFQCAPGYWGPQCNFTNCTKLSAGGQWQCKTAEDDKYRFLCTDTDTVTQQPINCQFCPGGYDPSSTDNNCMALPYNNQVTNLSVSTGYVAGIIVLAILAAIELIVIIVGVCYYFKEKKKGKNPTPPPPSTYAASGRNKTVPKSTAYTPAPLAEEEWSTNGNRRNYNEQIASDEYSVPTPNGSRREAAV